MFNLNSTVNTSYDVIKTTNSINYQDKMNIPKQPQNMSPKSHEKN